MSYGNYPDYMYIMSYDNYTDYMYIMSYGNYTDYMYIMSQGTVVVKIKEGGYNWLKWHLNTRYNRTHGTVGSDYIF